jgi:hypothetical protein
MIQNRKNEHVRGVGQWEARRRKNKRLQLGGGQAYELQVTKLSLKLK